MNKIIKRIIDVIFIAIIILLLCYFILKVFGIVNVFKVQTGSMEDGIHVGDYILSVKNDNYEVGDVVTYKYDGFYVTHRIVSIEDEKVITKGDANNIVDDEIIVNDIVGKVVYSGGILNIIFMYKYFLIAVMLTIYLFSCFIKVDK